MGSVGDETIKAGGVDPIEWTLYQEDGVTLLDMTNTVSVRVRTKDRISGTTLEFRSTDVPQKVVFDIPTAKVTFTPAVGDFTTVSTHTVDIALIDSSNNPVFVPRDHFPVLTIIDH